MLPLMWTNEDIKTFQIILKKRSLSTAGESPGFKCKQIDKE